MALRFRSITFSIALPDPIRASRITFWSNRQSARIADVRFWKRRSLTPPDVGPSQSLLSLACRVLGLGGGRPGRGGGSAGDRAGEFLFDAASLNDRLTVVGHIGGIARGTPLRVYDMRPFE